MYSKVESPLSDVVTQGTEVLRICWIVGFSGLEGQVVKWQRMDVCVEISQTHRRNVSCPENRAVLKWFEERAEFSEQETILFIQRVPLDRLPAETVTKMKSLEINEDYRHLCRNLSMIIGRESCET